VFSPIDCSTEFKVEIPMADVDELVTKIISQILVLQEFENFSLVGYIGVYCGESLLFN
jgi:hypothetical protein